MFLVQNSKVYDVLKYIAQVGLPAFGGLYFALSQTWGFPHGAEVVGTITSIDAFLGLLLHVSSAAYNNSEAKYDGSIDITETADKKNYMLNINGDPSDVVDKASQIVLKVNAIKKAAVKKKVTPRQARRT